MEDFEKSDGTAGAYAVGPRDIAGALDADIATRAELAVGPEERRET